MLTNCYFTKVQTSVLISPLQQAEGCPDYQDGS